MIFQTQHQLNILLIFLFFGFLFGLLNSIFNLIFLIKFQKNTIKILLNSVFYSFFFIFFIFLINLFNFGKFSLPLLFVFIVGLIVIKNSFSKLVVILQTKCYTKINKMKQSKRKNIPNDTSKKS